MHTDERTYYNEEQRMDSKWMWFFALFALATILFIGVMFLREDKNDWGLLAGVLGSIVLTDVLVLYLFKAMKLEIALSKKGFHYHFFALFSNKGTIDWGEVAHIELRRSPYFSYGKKQSLRYGQVFTMNTKMGMYVQLKNGKKKFFSIKDAEAFRAAYKRLELPLTLEE